MPTDEQREVEQELAKEWRVDDEKVKLIACASAIGTLPPESVAIIANIAHDLVEAKSKLVSITLKLREREQQGWIISDGSGTKFRIWDGGIPSWTDDPYKALRMARREDAEALAAEDEDAWGIYPLSKFPLPTPPMEVKVLKLELKACEDKSGVTNICEQYEARLEALRAENQRLQQERDEELAAWQQAIYKACCAVAVECGHPDHAIDGGGSDGDELAFTLAEIRQAFEILRDRATSAEARVAELREALRIIAEQKPNRSACYELAARALLRAEKGEGE